MSDLVERAAKHVAALNGHSEEWEMYLEEAEDYVNFIRADALEEAARYVEQIWAAGFGPSAVTAAIRALKEKKG